jgi:hypothetical protein
MLKFLVIILLERLPWHKTKRWATRALASITSITFHTTASQNQDPFKTNAYHVGPNHISKTGCPRICYHEFHDKLGKRYLCNEVKHRTWHVGLWNRWCIGIVAAFKGQSEAPEVVQMQSVLAAMVQLCLEHHVIPQKVKGHREYRVRGKQKLKSCPGPFVNMDAVRLVVCLRLQGILRAAGLYHGGLDGKFGKLSKAALKGYSYAEVLSVAITEQEAEQCIRVKKLRPAIKA